MCASLSASSFSLPHVLRPHCLTLLALSRLPLLCLLRYRPAVPPMTCWTASRRMTALLQSCTGTPPPTPLFLCPLTFSPWSPLAPCSSTGDLLDRIEAHACIIAELHWAPSPYTPAPPPPLLLTLVTLSSPLLPAAPLVTFSTASRHMRASSQSCTGPPHPSRCPARRSQWRCWRPAGATSACACGARPKCRTLMGSS